MKLTKKDLLEVIFIKLRSFEYEFEYSSTSVFGYV